MPAQPARYSWDRVTLRFRDRGTGRFVPHRRIFTQLNRIIAVSDRRILRLTESFQREEITLLQFKLALRTEIKTLHIAVGIIANGGVENMTPKLWGEVGARLRSEYGYLNDFATRIARGILPRTSGHVRSQARSYTANARLEFWKTTIRRFQEQPGLIVMGQRHLGSSTDNCRGCNSVKEKWFTLDRLPPIGSHECLWFCRCWIEFRIRRKR